MAKNLTAKQIAFANKFAECGNASQAYRHAYNAAGMASKTVWEAASRLVKNSKVTARVAKIQDAARDAAIMSIAGQTRRLQALSALAESKGTVAGIAAAIAAEKEINKLNSLIVDRSVIGAGIAAKGDMSSLYEDLDAEYERPCHQTKVSA